MHRFAGILHSHLETVCRPTDEQVAILYAHFRLYERWNRALNLSSIRDFEPAVVRHYCESLFLGAKLPRKPFSIVDVGSGAGFPGIPVAVLRPDCRVSLVESHQRKSVFLKEATRGLANVEVLARRAEQVEGRFDWLISRAVSWKDLRAVALRTASRMALLLGGADSVNILKNNDLDWDEPIPLPWSPQNVLLVGNVSRGTCYDS